MWLICIHVYLLFQDAWIISTHFLIGNILFQPLVLYVTSRRLIFIKLIDTIPGRRSEPDRMAQALLWEANK
jgi:hypothetical protein